MGKSMQLQQKIGDPKVTLSEFRNRLTFRVQLLTLILIFPMAVWQYWLGNLWMACLLAAFGCFLIFSLITGAHQTIKNHQAWGYVAFASCSVLYSTWAGAHQGVYWTFPVIASYFFLLKPDTSTKAALTFITAFTPLAFWRFELDEALRILMALSISTLLVSHFSTVVLRLHRDLIQLATCDPLTGCLNRSQLESLLSRALDEHKKRLIPSSLLLLDLDHFKQINDHYGHQQGDQVLIDFAAKVESSLRPQDKLFRLGGEEFLVFFDNCSEKDAISITEHLLDDIRNSEFSGGLKVTASAGIAAAHKDYKDWSLWLHQADEVLYQAKTEGRDSYRVAEVA